MKPIQAIRTAALFALLATCFSPAALFATTGTAISGDVVVDTRWELNAPAVSDGSIDGLGLYVLSATATLTATPQLGYLFTGWTGDASGTENPLTITMDSDKSIGATFEPDLTDADGDGISAYDELVVYGTDPALDDSDGDGLTDGREVNTHGSDPTSSDTDADGINDREEVEVYFTNPAKKDSDDDGFGDLFEINSGFEPNEATSTPDALSTIRTAIEFRFNAAEGVSYRIEDSTDLNNWNTVETDIMGQGGVVTRFYSTESQPKRYFRVRRN